MATDITVRPFRIDFPQDALDDIRRRIIGTRWPQGETVTDDSQGVPLAMMQELANYWAEKYDWRTPEAKLNALPQFITEIDGLDIHFIHVRSVHEDALPLIVTHGWPGSIIEQLKVVEPLTDPTTHGGGASDAFHLVVPSLPGYGFSGKPTATGWDPVHAATNDVRAGGLTRRPGRVHARPRRRHGPAGASQTGPSREVPQRSHNRRPPGQHHALLVDEHRRFVGSSVLGEQGGFLRPGSSRSSSLRSSEKRSDRSDSWL
jgi:pimeloyl-ACP methyl ester carboxylesterase